MAWAFENVHAVERPGGGLARVGADPGRSEEALGPTTNERGPDHNESRTWHGWHRHVSLVMLAYAIMAAVRYQANATTPKKTMRSPRQSSSGGRSRKSDASP